ncbi:hypothetical protein ACJIZ3_014841 [Penstemon smallii]|uniref:Transposase n=1 Tax=Penstemon smallii TaxID=265156 RepID=A0ABD3RKX0_9LAMI
MHGLVVLDDVHIARNQRSNIARDGQKAHLLVSRY